MTDIPKDAWEESKRLSEPDIHANIMKQSARQSLEQVLDKIEETDGDHPLLTYVFLLDIEDDDHKAQGHINAAGLPMDRLDLASRYMNEETYRIVDNFCKANPEEDPKQLERGLALNYIKTIIEVFDLKDPDIDLNALKEDLDTQSILSKDPE